MSVPKNPFIAYDNRLADAVPVASSTLAGAAINLSDMRPYTGHQASAVPVTYTVNCGSAKSADKLSVFNHNLFTTACTIEVHGSTDNFVSSDVTLHSFTPTNNLPFVRDFTSASYQYWRIRITGTTSPTLTIVCLGAGMEFPTSCPYGFDPLNRKVYGQANVSEQGLPLSKAVLYEEWSQQLQFIGVDPAWIRSTFMPAWKANLRGKPYLFGFDLTNYPNELYLVQSQDTVTSTIDYIGQATLTFNVFGVAL